MQPAIVFPLHEPEGVNFPHLRVIAPELKRLFSIAYLGVTPVTYERHREQVDALRADRFFMLLFQSPDSLVGEQFLHLYRQAALSSPPDQILHLCFVDRLAFILQSDHRRRFCDDVTAIQAKNTPLIFCRSSKAWHTHPRNYFEAENFVTTVGEFLFGKRFDFSWCHLAVRASRLKEIIKQIKSQDLSMLAEIVLALQEEVKMRDVDWLEWEDPFLLNRLGQDLKGEREKNLDETEKRLLGAISQIQVLLKSVRSEER